MDGIGPRAPGLLPKSGDLWHINRARRYLETTRLHRTSYTALIDDVLAILNCWSVKWTNQPQWSHFANCKSFLHEVEEALVPLSVVACHCDREESGHGAQPPLVVVDLCCGKGMFALLLSALAARRPSMRAQLRRIIMVEKQTNVRWDQIDYANEAILRETNEFIVPITIWKGVNIFADSFPSDLRSSIYEHDTKGFTRAVAAVVGIHLCRRLSSRFVELVNGLEEGRLAIVVLAPCCVPRLGASQCSVCIPLMPLLGHSLKTSDQVEVDRLAKLDIIYKTCWKCGVAGHSRNACHSTSKDMQLSINKLWKALEADAPSEHEAVLDLADLAVAMNPFQEWCNFLYGAFNERLGSKSIVDIVLNVGSIHSRSASKDEYGAPTDIKGRTDSMPVFAVLDTAEKGSPVKKKAKRDPNWNAGRKMTWIVGTDLSGARGLKSIDCA